MKLTFHHPWPLLAVSLAVAALGACGKSDERSAGQQVDAVLGAVKTGAALLEADARRGDAKLEPSMIDVDVAQVRVVLRGTAPDAESAARARTIVLALDGLTGVDNDMTVRKS